MDALFMDCDVEKKVAKIGASTHLDGVQLLFTGAEPVEEDGQVDIGEIDLDDVSLLMWEERWDEDENFTFYYNHNTGSCQLFASIYFRFHHFIHRSVVMDKTCCF
jgi:hypothetical protein